MFNHEPPGYRCPFCRNLAGESDHPLEIVHRTKDVFVKLNPFWHLRNPGSALVVPVEHIENLYDLPARLAEPIQAAIQATALAMKTAFGCDGVSTRQHNEPEGDQDVWHLHVHVFPRFAGDDLNRSERVPADEPELRRRGDLLRAHWPTA